MGRQQRREPPDAVEQRSGQSTRPASASTCATRRAAAVWSPTPLPAWARRCVSRFATASATRVFEHRCRELDQELRVFVPSDDPLKISELQITNTADRPRRVTVTYYVEWVLGTTRQTHQPAIVPAFDPESETLTATQSVERRLRHARCVRRRRQTPAWLYRRPRRVSRPQRRPRTSRRTRAHRARQHRAPRRRSVRRTAGPRRSAARRDAHGAFPAGPGRHRNRRRSSWCAAIATRPTSKRHGKRCAAAGKRCWQRGRCSRRTAASISC